MFKKWSYMLRLIKQTVYLITFPNGKLKNRFSLIRNAQQLLNQLMWKTKPLTHALLRKHSKNQRENFVRTFHMSGWMLFVRWFSETQKSKQAGLAKTAQTYIISASGENSAPKTIKTHANFLIKVWKTNINYSCRVYISITTNKSTSSHKTDEYLS